LKLKVEDFPNWTKPLIDYYLGNYNPILDFLLEYLTIHPYL